MLADYHIHTQFSGDSAYPLEQVVKGIQLNTSARRYGLTGSMPSAQLLRLYRDLGGTVITIGSDNPHPAHFQSDLCQVF